jgi:toxin ParE1/3/4
VKNLRLNLTDAAVRDILEQVDWFASQDDPGLGDRWERAVGDALLRLIRHPRAGASCHFTSSELHGVRRIPVGGFPNHLIFYRLRDSDLLILRVLHGARDLEPLL